MLTDVSRILQVRPDPIPREMKETARWVCWVAVPKLRRDGSTEYTKEPRQPRSPKRKASSTNAGTWSDFETAVGVVQRGEAHGLGFALGDGWAGVDVDDALTADARRLSQQGDDIVLRFQSYSELSPSGTGVHVIVRGELPEGRREGKIELYAAGRYFTVTGHIIPSASSLVEPRQEELLDLFEQLGRMRSQRERASRQRGERSEPPIALTTPPASDDEIIEVAHRICRGFPALWAGETANYDGDDSRADLAIAGFLAFMCGPGQHELVRSLMERSGLVRDKWRESRPGGTYLDLTIRRAYQGRGDDQFFRWGREPQETAGVTNGVIQLLTDDSGVDDGTLSLVRERTLDDIGFARRLATESLGDIRYVSDWQKWIFWDGCRWQLDDGAAATQAAQNLRDRLWREFAELPHEHKTEQALRFIKACGAAKRLRDIVTLTKNQDIIRVRYEHFDQRPYLLNVRNGTLDLRTGTLGPHRREDYLTQLAAVDFIPDAPAQLWHDFIAAAMQDDQELMRFLQVSAGLMLTGDVSPQLLWCHSGVGSNGKSTFLGAIANMLGDYAVAAPPNFLMMQQGSSHPTELAMLYGKRLVTAIECEGGQRMRESFVKMLTGGDKLAARRMREDFWMMDPTWHVHVSYNTPPTLNGTDEGIRRRLKIIPWRACFKGPNQDKTVKERLESDELRSGILNWCLAGLQDYLANGLPSAVAVAVETDEYVAGQDLMGVFLDECTGNPWGHCYFDEFIRAFHGWLEARGENIRLWTGKRVTNELKQRGYEKRRSTAGADRGRVRYQGLELKIPALPPA